MKNSISMDECEKAEKGFPFPNLLQTDYFTKYKAAYKHCRATSFPIGKRNYLDLLQTMKEVHECNSQHANSFAKRLRGNTADWKNCEAVYSEMIVYRYYIRPKYEGLIRDVELNADECDLIIHRLDGSRAYLEVFCIMPDFKTSDVPGQVVVGNFKVHTQLAFSSVRQKLLRKIKEQGQLSEPRDNYAVIDLNDALIANEFTICSSLSSGYKIHLDRKTLKSVGEGYDWKQSVFDDECTNFLKGVIFFYLGNYEDRRYIVNDKFGQPAVPAP